MPAQRPLRGEAPNHAKVALQVTIPGSRNLPYTELC